MLSANKHKVVWEAYHVIIIVEILKYAYDSILNNVQLIISIICWKRLVFINIIVYTFFLINLYYNAVTGWQPTTARSFV